MCRTFSCSEGYNLSGFKSLLPNPNLNVSPPAPGASHTGFKSNILYPCAASSLLPLSYHTCVEYFQCPRFPRYVWTSDPWCVCFLKLGSIKGQPARQLIYREAGSINISYVQLSRAVHIVNCINRSHRFRTRRIKCSPRVPHLPIDHINA